MTHMASDESREPVRLKRRPWWSRVSGPQLLMIIAGILAFLANLVVLRGQEQIVLVAVAASDVNPGVPLTVDHVRFVEIEASSELIESAIPRSDIEDYRGMIITSPFAEGDLINRSQLRAAAATMDRRAMSIPIDAANAVGGRIAVGDRVDVIAVDDGVARYVLAGAEVIERSGESGSGTLTAGRSFYLVVALTSSEALELSSAMDRAEIHVVRSTGASSPTSPSFDPEERAGDLPVAEDE